ncbi:DUF6702 family protein [uncultured Polaribacter sp.]|uniref:DUF6702 family protein n=1 Tax=uncultured Polaribacter sp. TaxID=174711 RepID=UPI00260F6F51|nr:DUF6702 family protein [uncultured Polaribacter sp.]
MRVLIIICIVLLTISSTKPTHDSVSATFNIIKKGHVLLLEIEFDEENYIKFGDANSLEVTKQDLEKYLNKTTSWYFDGKETTPQVLTITSQREHAKVLCFLVEARKNVKTVKVKNEFLIDVKDQANIIKFDLNNSYKDFRLHKGRTQIEVNYN